MHETQRKTWGSPHAVLLGIIAAMLLLGMAGVQHAWAQDVNVTNPVTDPVNIAPPADSQPFMSSVYIVLSSSSNFGFPTLVNTGEVPQGYRLIITHINLHFKIPKTERVDAEIRIDNTPQLADDEIRIVLPMEVQTHAWDTSRLLLVAHESVALFVEADGVMSMSITLKKPPAEPLGYVTLQGHYAKVPPARP